MLQRPIATVAPVAHVRSYKSLNGPLAQTSANADAATRTMPLDVSAETNA